MIHKLKENLAFWNPWWEGEPGMLDDLRQRGCMAEIEPLFARKEMLALTGVRRSGKTSIMLLLVRKALKDIAPENVLYANLDDPAFGAASIGDIVQAYEELKTPEGRRLLFLDEVQESADWERWLKRLYDSGIDMKIVISGSNSSLLKTEYSRYLSGRSISYDVFPLSFEEYLEFKGVGIRTEGQRLARANKIRHMLASYMEQGGFPEVVLEPDRTLGSTLLKEYYSAILARDIVGRNGIREGRKLEMLVGALVTNVSSPASAKSMGGTLDLNTRTVQEYFSLLEDAYLVFFVNHFSYSMKAQYTYPRKVYCVDTGLRNAVGFSFSEDAGRLMENLVYLRLRREGEVYYWKEHEAEVDFVVKKGRGVCALVQSCYDMGAEKTWRRESSALIKAMRNFGLSSGTVVTWDDERKVTADGLTIECVPLWKWLLSPPTSSPSPRRGK